MLLIRLIPNENMNRHYRKWCHECGEKFKILNVKWKTIHLYKCVMPWCEWIFALEIMIFCEFLVTMRANGPWWSWNYLLLILFVYSDFWCKKPNGFFEVFSDTNRETKPPGKKPPKKPNRNFGRYLQVYPKSTPLPLFAPVCNFEALLGANLI